MMRSLKIALVLFSGIVLGALPAFAQDGQPETPVKDKPVMESGGAENPGTGMEGEKPGSGEMPQPGTDTQPGMTEKEMEPQPDSAPKSDMDTAIREVPTYEEPQVPRDEATAQETFLSLAEDFIFLSEIGGRGPGRVPLWPRGELKVGPFHVFPYLEGRIGWTSNVYDTEHGDSAAYASEGGGAAAKYDFLGGRATVRFAGDYKHRNYFGNVHDSYSEWTGGGGLSYHFLNGLWFEGGVKWEHLVDPVNIQYAGRLQRDQVYPYIHVGFDNAFGNKINIQAGLEYTNANFRNTTYSTGDREEWDAWLKASYPFWRGTYVFLRYDYVWANRDSVRINDLSGGHELSGGIEGTIPLTNSERLTGELSVGYRRDLYGASRNLSIGTATIPTDNHRTHGTVTVHGALRYLVGAKTSLNLQALRTMEFSPSSNYAVVDRLDLAMTHNCLRNLISRAGVFVERSEPSLGGHFTRYGAGLGSRYLLTDNIDLDFSADWSKRNSTDLGFDTKLVEASIGVTIYLAR